MIYCSHCKKALTGHEISYCPVCGKPVSSGENTISPNVPKDSIRFRLSSNDKRSYSIDVYSDKVVFEGRFWYLKNKEFYRCRTWREVAFIKNYIGMGYLAKRSYRKCIAFIIGGTILEITKTILDKLSEWADKANNYLRWIDKSIELPKWMTYSVNTLVCLSIILALVFLFSKKKVVEISFLDKRICIPQSSINRAEYNMLHQSITALKGTN